MHVSSLTPASRTTTAGRGPRRCRCRHRSRPPSRRRRTASRQMANVRRCGRSGLAPPGVPPRRAGPAPSAGLPARAWCAHERRRHRRRSPASRPPWRKRRRQLRATPPMRGTAHRPVAEHRHSRLRVGRSDDRCPPPPGMVIRPGSPSAAPRRRRKPPAGIWHTIRSHSARLRHGYRHVNTRPPHNVPSVTAGDGEQRGGRPAPGKPESIASQAPSSVLGQPACAPMADPTQQAAQRAGGWPAAPAMASSARTAAARPRHRCPGQGGQFPGAALRH